MTIDSKREKIPDVPAVYFVNPTEANLARIADVSTFGRIEAFLTLKQDCAAGLYEKFYVNFADPLPRPLLESFAQDLVARGAARNVSAASGPQRQLMMTCTRPCPPDCKSGGPIFELFVSRSNLILVPHGSVLRPVPEAGTGRAPGTSTHTSPNLQQVTAHGHALPDK